MAEYPEPSVVAIIQLHHIQAMLSLGAIANPATGHPDPVNRQRAEFELSLLKVLQEKTEGNLSEEEDRILNGVIETIEGALREV